VSQDAGVLEFGNDIFAEELLYGPTPDRPLQQEEIDERLERIVQTPRGSHPVADAEVAVAEVEIEREVTGAAENFRELFHAWPPPLSFFTACMKRSGSPGLTT